MAKAEINLKNGRRICVSVTAGAELKKKLAAYEVGGKYESEDWRNTFISGNDGETTEIVVRVGDILYIK